MYVGILVHIESIRNIKACKVIYSHIHVFNKLYNILITVYFILNR